MFTKVRWFLEDLVWSSWEDRRVLAEIILVLFAVTGFAFFLFVAWDAHRIYGVLPSRGWGVAYPSPFKEYLAAISALVEAAREFRDSYTFFLGGTVGAIRLVKPSQYLRRERFTFIRESGFFEVLDGNGDYFSDVSDIDPEVVRGEWKYIERHGGTCVMCYYKKPPKTLD
jgi:hypothetical protein